MARHTGDSKQLPPSSHTHCAAAPTVRLPAGSKEGAAHCAKAHTPRCTHTKMHTHQDAHTPRCTHTKMHTRQDAHTPRCTHTKMHTYQDAHTPRCTHIKMHTHQDAHTPRCTHTKMHTHQDAHISSIAWLRQMPQCIQHPQRFCHAVSGLAAAQPLGPCALPGRSRQHEQHAPQCRSRHAMPKSAVACW